MNKVAFDILYVTTTNQVKRLKLVTYNKSDLANWLLGQFDLAYIISINLTDHIE